MSHADAKRRHQQRVAAHTAKPKKNPRLKGGRHVKLVGTTNVKKNAPTLGKGGRVTSIRRKAR